MTAPLSPTALACVRLSIESALRDAVAKGARPARQPSWAKNECCAVTAPEWCRGLPVDANGYAWLGLDKAQAGAIAAGFDDWNNAGCHDDAGLYDLGAALARKWVDGVTP